MSQVPASRLDSQPALGRAPRYDPVIERVLRLMPCAPEPPVPFDEPIFSLGIPVYGHYFGYGPAISFGGIQAASGGPVELAMPAAGGALAAQVSIVIAARNYAPFLAEAIESALAQTVRCEVLYVDDSSSDRSLAIAGAYRDKGLRVVDLHEHRGVCAARNRGAALANGDHLLFLDGDDVMPADYVERKLAVLQPGCPFVYGPARAFGAFELVWQPPEWGRTSLWQTNFVNTSALWARWAFEAAGGWREGARTMWDWDLALRGARLGTPRRSDALLKYRQHKDSWSANNRERTLRQQEVLKPLVRRLNARLSVGTIFSGRLPDLVPAWTSALAQAVRQIDTPERPELVILDSSRNEAIHELLAREVDRYRASFSAIRIQRYPRDLNGTTELERRSAVARFMAGACSRLRTELRGDIHWLVEDDIHVPVQGGSDLFEALLHGWEPPQAVAGCYRNRHAPDLFVGGHWRDGQPHELTQLPAAPFEVDYTGTGCVMLWADQCPSYWVSHLNGIPAHDWEWSARLRARRGRILMLPDVRCGHAVDARTILAC